MQLAAANADIAAGEKRQRHSVLKQTGERQFVAITVDAYNRTRLVMTRTAASDPQYRRRCRMEGPE